MTDAAAADGRLITGVPAVPQGRIVEDTVVPARAPWSARLRAGQFVRFIDLEGRQAIDFLCFGTAPMKEPFEGQVERYHMPNTIKIPKTILIGRGTVLYSQFARPMMTVVEDTMSERTGGGHDTIFGCCSFACDDIRYGRHNAECCQRNFQREMARHGLGPEHVVPNVNWFMDVPVGPGGHAEITEGRSRPGDFVDLRAEMDVLVVISNCPQELNPATGGGPTPVRAVVWEV